MQSSLGGDEMILSLRSGSDNVRRNESGVPGTSHWEAYEGLSKSREGGEVAMESLDTDLAMSSGSLSCSKLRKLPQSSSKSSTRPSRRSMGEPTTDEGASESSCFHS